MFFSLSLSSLSFILIDSQKYSSISCMLFHIRHESSGFWWFNCDLCLFSYVSYSDVLVVFEGLFLILFRLYGPEKSLSKSANIYFYFEFRGGSLSAFLALVWRLFQLVSTLYYNIFRMFSLLTVSPSQPRVTACTPCLSKPSKKKIF